MGKDKRVHGQNPSKYARMAQKYKINHKTEKTIRKTNGVPNVESASWFFRHIIILIQFKYSYFDMLYLNQ